MKALGCPVRHPILRDPTNLNQKTRNLAWTRKVRELKLELDQLTHETVLVHSGIHGGFGMPDTASDIDGSHRSHLAGLESGLKGAQFYCFMYS